MRRGWLVTATALTVLTACTGPADTPPPQTVTQPPSTTVPSEPTLPKAPPVPSPLNASAFENEPCLSLTEPQQKQFGLDAGKVTDAAVEGKSCFYRYPDPKSQAVSVTYASKATSGLSVRYVEHARGAWDFWQPAEIDGYPGVAYDATDAAEGADTDFCHFAVGLSHSLYYWVTAVDTAGTAKCSVAKAVATAVLATIKAGG